MKKLNQNGFAHLALVAIAVVVGVAGFAGYKVYQSKHIDAKAYNWSTSHGIGTNVSVYYCKSDQGNNWILRAYAKNNTASKQSWELRTGTSPTQAIGTYKTVLSGNLVANQKSNVHLVKVSKSSAKLIEPKSNRLFGTVDSINLVSNCN